MRHQTEFYFEWDEAKADSNLRKHGISFDLAGTVFLDPRLLTVPDVTHSADEDRWISIGLGANGALVTVVHLWRDIAVSEVEVRIISARRSTSTEKDYYQRGHESSSA